MKTHKHGYDVLASRVRHCSATLLQLFLTHTGGYIATGHWLLQRQQKQRREGNAKNKVFLNGSCLTLSS